MTRYMRNINSQRKRNNQTYAQTNKLIRLFVKNLLLYTMTLNSSEFQLWLYVLFYSSFVYTCVCVSLHIQSPLRECRSIRSGASGLPYYCAPLVCISDVMELLVVRRHNKPKTKNLNTLKLDRYMTTIKISCTSNTHV